MWSIGPSSLIGPVIFFCEKNFINGPPMRNTMIKEDIKNNLVILAPILVVYGFPEFLYQEYVEPLIILLFFLILKTNLHKLYFKNISLSNFIFLSYFAVYLAGSIYFKHFAFSTFEEWEIFLNAQ